MTPTGNKSDILSNMQNPKALKEEVLYKKYKLDGKKHHEAKEWMRKYFQLIIQCITMVNNGEFLNIKKRKNPNNQIENWTKM